MDLLAGYLDKLLTGLNWWSVLGFAAQGLFFSRFLVQWLHSERVKRSEIPVGFWFLSVFGGAIMLVYVVHLADLVLILGQATGLVVYLRNIHLIFRERALRADEVRPPAI